MYCLKAPLELLHHIREGQSALAALVSTESSPQGPGRESLDQFLAQLPGCGRLESCDRHIEPNLQSHGIGGSEKTPLKRSGTMCFIGYSRSPMLQQRLYLNVSKMNTPGISMMANSEHCSAEFENGEQLWPENSYMHAWSNKNTKRSGISGFLAPWGQPQN